jgi:hypothetical protein
MYGRQRISQIMRYEGEQAPHGIQIDIGINHDDDLP